MGKELPPRKYLLGAGCRVGCVLLSIYFVLRFMSLPHFLSWETSCLLLLPYKMGLAWHRGWGPGLGGVALTQRQAGLRAPARGCVRGDQGRHWRLLARDSSCSMLSLLCDLGQFSL